MRVLHVDCFSGLSGDMWLGALLDLGAPIEQAVSAINNLGIEGLALDLKKVMINDLAATSAIVCEPTGKQPSRTWASIHKILLDSAMPERIKTLSIAAFSLIARAEAGIHSSPIDEVHFHELGACDALVDIVGSCALFDSLKIERCYCAPIPLPRGFVKTTHGLLPLPAPATMAVLKGAEVSSADIDKEITTPTGAALAMVFADEFRTWPNLRVIKTGYGAGSMSLPWPNLLRLILGETDESDSVYAIEANIDDMDPRVYDSAVRALFYAGALDVWINPITMKKGRPALTLSALASADRKDACVLAIMTETTSLGVRYFPCSRQTADRKIVELPTDYGDVRFKVASFPGAPAKISVEFEDAKSIADREGLPLVTLLKELEALGQGYLHGDFTEQT